MPLQGNMRLQGRTAIVTGGASGFGAGIARLFAAQGAKIAILDLNQEVAAALAIELGKDAVAIGCDVADGDQVKRAVAEATRHLGALDIVVNNAGISHSNRPMLEVDEAEFDRVFAVNVKSIFHMTHAVVPTMRKTGKGVIVNIGSTAGLRPRPGLTWYNGSKGAVNVITKSMAIELAPDRIRVCGIAPVIGETALLETFMGRPDTPENRATFIAGIPLGRMSTPADIAHAALYLASNEADFITGVILEVDGGRCI